MLRFTSGTTCNCEYTSRRDFLRVGAVGAFGLTLSGLMRQMALGGVDPNKDDFNCILLWMQGGPSHIDTMDPKPNAPVEIRGEFQAIPTCLPGVQLSEHLPNLAQQLNKTSILRSLTSPDSSHGTADHFMMSGYRFNPAITHPCYGSVVAKEKGYRNGIPPFVQLGTNIDRRFNGGLAGFIGAVHNPFEIAGDPSNKDFRVQGLSLMEGIDLGRVGRRVTMLEAVNKWQKKLEGQSGIIDTMDKYQQLADGLVTSERAKKAFNLAEENSKSRDEYGMNSLGQSCLLARRLIEAGVRFVTVTDGGWDTHQNNFMSLKNRLLPRLDQAYAALLSDLHARGMLDKTLVVWMGDFGRTPKVNPAAGRDHWGQSTAVCMGGGGVKTGIVVGSSNEFAEMPKENPLYVPDVAATIYHALGIDLETYHTTPDGRPIKVNNDGRLIPELV
jgi:Protein of unknown function (DUF1501)